MKTEEVRQLVESCLPEEGEVYIAQLQLPESAVKPKIFITIDSDEGIRIEQCAKVSRCLNRKLDEMLGEENPYSIEVSSPGVDQPLTLPRQYRKHVGRTLEVTLTDGTKQKGKLESVDENGILIQAEIKQGKKTVVEPMPLAFDAITKSHIVISFK